LFSIISTKETVMPRTLARLSFAIVTFFLVATALTGCSGFGPRMLPGTRLDYNVSVDRSTNEEMLLNLVRLKYFENPVFLQVGSIASVYSLGFTAGFNADIPDQRDFSNGVYSRFAPSVGGSYSDSPTVTYTPYQGQVFAQQVLAELDFERFSLLYRSGWPIEHLLPIFVYRIGGLTHDYDNRRGFNPDKHAQFMEAASILGKMDDAGDFDIITITPNKESKDNDKGKDKDKNKDKNKDKDKDDDDDAPVKYTIAQFRFQTPADAERLGKLLNYKFKTQSTKHGHYIARVRLVAARDFTHKDEDSPFQEMPVRMRNLFRGMEVLALGMHTPERDVKAHKVYELRANSLGIMDIRCAPSKPGDAYVSVKHGDDWFFIANDDTQSKEAFQLLLAVFAIQASELPKNAPVLTLPLGD
jgi:hypothetical protein